MIGVVDYGLGNVQAIINVYRSLDIPVNRATGPTDFAETDRIVLPGVGAFDEAMNRLNHSGMRHALDEMVLDREIPVLGICVGMQMFARTSEEGVAEGLGWIDAEVRRLDVRGLARKPHLPHMGWNSVEVRKDSSLFVGFDAEAEFYFLHSYGLVPTHQSAILTETHYGRSFVSSVQSGNIYGVQFHPEKSHNWGTDLLRNFATA